MKKLLFTFFASLMICFSLALLGCGNNEEQYYGTWNSVSVKKDGVLYTIEEIEGMGDYSFSDFRIEIKEGAKAYVYSDGYGSYYKWELTNNGIKIGIRECYLENNFLAITNNGITVYLSK